MSKKERLTEAEESAFSWLVSLIHIF